jgi:hypothetical protein
MALVAASSFGASVTSASFSGGTGTFTSGGTVYAKQGAALTLGVNTDATTKCVRVTDGTTTVEKDSASAQTSWTFGPADSSALFVAGSGNGVKTVTATAFKNSNGQHHCTANGGEAFGTQQASYILDNAAPTVTGALSPSPNAAGWNKSNVAITWTATDAGSGMASGPTPATDSVNVETPAGGVTKSSSATDNVGNAGNGSVTVKLDKTAPSINPSRNPAPNANGWNNTNVTVTFTCSDALSGIKSCTGGGSVTVSTEGANQSVPGTAVDNADNTNNSGVNGINIDKTAPSLSGAPTTPANADGWYNGAVTIHWACSDALSGIAGSCPADSTISGDGLGQTASATVSDNAGNSANATSSPAVDIDTTAPSTDAVAPSGWQSSDAAVTLTGSDNLSGVKATFYILDGGVQQTGTSVSISTEGVHTLQYWSVDKAGNAEAKKSVEVKVDKTAPSILASQNPLANTHGWNNTNVTVHFDCSDSLSGIKSCTSDHVVSAEGQDQLVSGTAEDNAGNTAGTSASVSIDKTPPSIAAAADRSPNGNGWYNADVDVNFTCDDALSGVAFCPATVTLGEGSGHSVSGTAKDAADNEKSGGLSGMNVDETAPTLSGAPTSSPNGNGWYHGDVTVAWTCGDALSGIDGSCPANSTVAGEGANLSASETVSDKAGNSTTKTVDGIKIDRTPPTTSADVPAPLQSGWYAGPVTVTLTALDNLSDVDATYYSVDGGAAQAYTGPFAHSFKGSHAIRFWSVDKAGNIEDSSAAANAITLKIDGVPPVITGQRTPDANAFGWNNGPVAVNFFCDDAESGVALCAGDTTVASDTPVEGVTVPGNAQDNAGNTAEASVGPIRVDLTPPALSGLATTDPNAAGWYKGDVVVHWTGSDALSGIDPATQPADSVVTGEGANLGAGPVTISDKAGNASAPASVNGIKIDRTAPVIDGGPATQPNSYGWYGGDVIVAFTCTDNLSGVAICPSDKLVSGNGANQSVTSDPAADLAGNTTSGKTVSGINIDGLPPQTTADNQCTKTNGWCTGSTANVVLTASDQAGLSGVKEVHYSVNGGAEQVAAGATKTVTVPLDGSGEATVTFYAVDKAGNKELLNGVSLKYDNIAPMVTHTLAPSPNADEWNNSNVTVHFDAKDNDGGSGVDPSRTTPDVLVSDETAGRTINGEGYDIAGNRGTDKVTVKLDKTGPSITGAVTSGTLGNNGWYVGPVTVHFTCSDALAGVAVCPDDVTLTSNGANQSVTRTATDKAGNTRSTTVSGISIDQEKPSITLNGIASGGIYTLGAVPNATCSASDDFSGPGPCSVQFSGGLANGVGTFNYTANATDMAGNTSQVTGSFRVVYNVADGVAFFLQPINDTAHMKSLNTSIFKAGSTVPAKFELRNANGAIVQANTPPVWETPARGSAITAPPNEDAYGAIGDTTTTFRWDATAQQYIYNWNTDKNQVNYFWRIGVKLDDGQTYVVNVGLR